MSATRVLGVVIAVTFMFYVAALISSGLVEWLSNLMKKRAKYLLRGLRALLEGNKQAGELKALTQLVTVNGQVCTEMTLYKSAVKTVEKAAERNGTTYQYVTGKAAEDLLRQVMRHPLVLALAQAKADGTITRLPSYLPAQTFVDALFDILHKGGGSAAHDIALLRQNIEALDEGQLKQALQALLRAHSSDVTKFGKAVEHWYDDQMDRVSGAYKRWAKRWVVVIGIAIAAVMHLDAIGLAQNLWQDDTARAAIVKAAEDTKDCQDLAGDEKASCIDTTVSGLAGEGPPIGPQAWSEFPNPGWDLVLLFLGIALTGAASSLGAPFWFDALGRLDSLRNSGPKPSKSSDG